MNRKGISGYFVIAVLILGCVAGASTTAQAQVTSYRNLHPIQQRHVSGFLSTVLNGEDEASRVQRAAEPKALPAGLPANYQPGPSGCANRLGRNVKVNQNCLNVADPDLSGRSQAQNETWIATDSRDGNHVLAAYNDYRRGDGTCGVSYSIDGGRTFADSTVPNGFTRGPFVNSARQYWQGGGDPSVAWDTKGNAYLSCLAFNRGSAVSPNPDQSSAHFVFRSTGNNGASFTFTGRPVVQHADPAGAGNFLLDKQLMTVDATVGSPFQDRVYVTWTTFDMDGTSYIFGAYSADYAETFSAPVLISRNSALCDNILGLPTPQGTCNTNQFSQPFTGPDGALYVTWANYNNAVSGNENRNQMLLAKSTDGGQSFGAPVRAGYFYELPDCATYQNGKDPFRSCVPEKGPSANSFFRAANYPIGTVNPRDRTVVVTYGSYINRNSNEFNGCRPTGFAPATGINTYDGVKNGNCNNDILLSVSRNGGSSFTGTTIDPRLLTSVTNAPGQRVSSQFWQGATFTPRGALAVMSYDRQYGSGETTGFSDITVSSSHNLTTFRQDRATSSSMPPPTQFTGTFWGDYSAIAAAGETVLPLWSDTRPLNLITCPGSGTPGIPPRVCASGADNASFANDQDIYVTAMTIG